MGQVQRRRLLLGAVVLITTPLASRAQLSAKTYRIGVLAPSSSPSAAPLYEELRLGLRELGYVEGKNIAIEYRYAEGRFERFPELAASLVSMNVDVIVAVSTDAVVAAQRATTTIPIVMPISIYPVELGIIKSLGRPGGNVTGLTADDFAAKRLELLKQAAPRITRVVFLRNPAFRSSDIVLKECETTAARMGLDFQTAAVYSPEDLDGAMHGLGKRRATGLYLIEDPLTYQNRAKIAELAIKQRLPSISRFQESAEDGVLMSYGNNIGAAFRSVATYIDKILKGTKPADLPVQQATTLELVINLKTAKALGLTIPQSLLLRADRVVQ